MDCITSDRSLFVDYRKCAHKHSKKLLLYSERAHRSGGEKIIIRLRLKLLQY